MKISVCMGIYNGEKYIEAQLQSVLKQTIQADEVILCDDNSGDRSAELAQSFIDRNCLSGKWRLFCNKENRGYPGNFYHAMSLCTGDVVFLADQDDIWKTGKIEKMLRVMEQHPEAKAVCCKFGLIDGADKEIHSLMNPAKTRETGCVRKVTVADVFYKCEWPGMVMAYRNEWYQTWAAEEGTEKLQLAHDFLIAARAAEENGFLQLDEELALHRRHDHNTGNEEHRIRRLLNKRRKLAEIEKYLLILDTFKKEKILRTEEGKAALLKKTESMQGRYAALQSGKLTEVIKNAWRHRGETRGATFLCDFVIVKGK